MSACILHVLCHRLIYNFHSIISHLHLHLPSTSLSSIIYHLSSTKFWTKFGRTTSFLWENASISIRYSNQLRCNTLTATLIFLYFEKIIIPVIRRNKKQKRQGELMLSSDIKQSVCMCSLRIRGYLVVANRHMYSLKSFCKQVFWILGNVNPHFP